MAKPDILKELRTFAGRFLKLAEDSEKGNIDDLTLAANVAGLSSQISELSKRIAK